MKISTRLCLVYLLILGIGRSSTSAARTTMPEQAPYPPAAEKLYSKGMKAHREGRAEQAFTAWLKAAGMGHPKAQNNVGQAYLTGEGTEQNTDVAMIWFHRAANAGVPQAQLQVAMEHFEAERIEEGIALLRASAEQGCDDAEYFYGSCWEDGFGLEQNDSLALYWYRRAAAKEQPFALTALGKRYLRGQGVTQDHDKALEMFRRADEQGDGEASGLLALCYINGTGVVKDMDKALAYVRRGANADDPDSQFLLGVYYQGDAPGAPVYPRAIHWWRLAAEQEHTAAADSLGMCYLRGTGVQKDPREALRLLTLAQDTLAQIECHRILARQGDIESQYHLGCAYVDEIIDGDVKQGQDLLRKASAAGHIAARYKLGESLLSEKHDLFSSVFRRLFSKEDENEEKPEDGLSYIRSAAEAGYPPAQFALGNCCLRGEDNLARDTLAGIEWYRKAADNGYGEALYQLGMLYYNGQGVEKSLPDAFQWWRRSAEAGYSEAMYTVGFCYSRGQGVERDSLRAFDYFLQGAEANNANAQYELGQCYRNGDGIRRNERKAFQWYARAADSNKDARRMLAYCYARAHGTAHNRAAAAYWYRKAGLTEMANLVFSHIGKRVFACNYVTSAWDGKRNEFTSSLNTYNLILADVDDDNETCEELWIEIRSIKDGAVSTYYADRIERLEVPIISADGTSTDLTVLLLVARSEWKGGEEYGFMCDESTIETILGNPAFRGSIPEIRLAAPLELTPDYLRKCTDYKKGVNLLSAHTYRYTNKIVYTEHVEGSHRDYKIRLVDAGKNEKGQSLYYTTIEAADGRELLLKDIKEMKLAFNTDFTSLAQGFIRLITVTDKPESWGNSWTIEDDKLFDAIFNIRKKAGFEKAEPRIIYDIYTIRPGGNISSKNAEEEEDYYYYYDYFLPAFF